MLKLKAPIWLKQVGETPYQYELFCKFLSLPIPTTKEEKMDPDIPTRNYESVSELTGVSYHRIGQFGRMNLWYERAGAFDQHQAKYRGQALDRELSKDAAVWARKQLDFNKRKLVAAEKMREKVLAMIEKHPNFNPKESVAAYANALKIALGMEAEALDVAPSKKVDITHRGNITYSSQEQEDALTKWRRDQGLIVDKDNETVN